MAGTPSSSVPTGGGTSADLAYAEITANVTVSAGSSAAADVVLTLPAFTADGISLYIVEFFTPGLSPGAGTMVVERWLDGVAQCIIANPITANSTTAFYYRSSKLTVAAGSRTYSIRAWRGGANGTVAAGTGTGGAFEKAWARVITAPA